MGALLLALAKSIILFKYHLPTLSLRPMLTTSIILSARSVHFLKKEMTTGLNSGASLSGHLYKKRDVKDPKIIDISPLYMCMYIVYSLQG